MAVENRSIQFMFIHFYRSHRNLIEAQPGCIRCVKSLLNMCFGRVSMHLAGTMPTGFGSGVPKGTVKRAWRSLVRSAGGKWKAEPETRYMEGPL